MAHHDKDKKKRKVRRLVDVDVSHVSIVDKPANRTPFKAIKRDQTQTDERANPMNITLKNMFGSRGPEVTSVIANTRPKAEAVAKMLLEGDTAEITEQDGLFVVRKSGVEATADEQIIHLGKDAGVAYTVANMRKELSLYDVSNTSFEETMKAEGFVPGLMVGMDVLHQTIFNIAMSEETNSPEAFATAVNRAIDEFQKYVGDLVGALPEKAFKFEKALAAVTPTGVKPLHFTPEGFSEEAYDVVFGDEAPDPSKTMDDPDGEGAQASAEADDDAKAGEGAKAGEEAAEGAQASSDDDKAKEASAEGGVPKPDNLEELPEGTGDTPNVDFEKAMQGMIDNLTKTVGDQITAAVKPLNDRLDAQDAAVGKLTKAVGGAVATTPEADDDNVVQLSKGDNTGASTGGVPPLMDTAYNVSKG